MNTTTRGRLPYLRVGQWVFTDTGRLAKIRLRTITDNPHFVTYSCRSREDGTRDYHESRVRPVKDSPINWAETER